MSRVSKLVSKLFMGRIQPTFLGVIIPFTTDRYISYQQDIPVEKTVNEKQYFMVMRGPP